MLTQGLLPGEQVKFDGFINSDEELEEIATEVASGKNVVFPEGNSHFSKNQGNSR